MISCNGTWYFLNTRLFPVFAFCFCAACGGGSSGDAAPTVTPSPSPGIPSEITIQLQENEQGFIHPKQDKVLAGELSSFELVPDAGYVVTGVEGCGGELSGTTYRVQTESNCTITPSFQREVREDVSGLFTMQSYEKDGHTLSYHLYSPDTEQTDQALPLILAIHGTVEGLAIENGLFENPHLIDNIGEAIGRPVATAWMQTHLLKQYPAYVIAPRISFSDEHWADEFLSQIYGEVIDQLVSTGAVDPNRLYVVGHSIGGTVSWEMPRILAGKFAAILPMAGDLYDLAVESDTTFEMEYPYVSIWAFSHLRDWDGGVATPRRVVDRLRQSGIDMTRLGNITERAERKRLAELLTQPRRHFYSELTFSCTAPGGDCHWGPIDTAAQEPLFFSWLFRQRRIQIDAIEQMNVQYDASVLSLSWAAQTENIQDQAAIWIRYNDDVDWQLLQRLNASELQYTGELQAETPPGMARIRLVLHDQAGRIYGFKDSATFAL